MKNNKKQSRVLAFFTKHINRFNGFIDELFSLMEFKILNLIFLMMGVIIYIYHVFHFYNLDMSVLEGKVDKVVGALLISSFIFLWACVYSITQVGQLLRFSPTIRSLFLILFILYTYLISPIGTSRYLSDLFFMSPSNFSTSIGVTSFLASALLFGILFLKLFSFVALYDAIRKFYSGICETCRLSLRLISKEDLRFAKIEKDFKNWLKTSKYIFIITSSLYTLFLLPVDDTVSDIVFFYSINLDFSQSNICNDPRHKINNTIYYKEIGGDMALRYNEVTKSLEVISCKKELGLVHFITNH
ncbi:hypothetical protein DZF79_05095 [Vibrio parahaemolyticus]|nr:hypothetical protein [Vibrio parahaemolyticus]